MNRYEYKAIEKKCRAFWAQSKIYQWQPTENRESNFSIDTPPPTISGMLHIGHVYSYVQADVIARFWRMYGKNVFFPIGFDNNGLPTERLVEKKFKIKAKQVSKSEFKDMCNEVIKDSIEEFKSLFQSLGLSFDWSNTYETIGTKAQKISQMSFIDLHNKGFMKKEQGPSFWDTVDQTAISQAEIEDAEQKGKMVKIRFHKLGNTEITIATTRPEMLAACVAVFVNPNDKRYSNVIGKEVKVPIYDHRVKIFADDKVDMDKGTGAVMCCTFGDIQDVLWWRAYKLKTVVCINKYGRMQNSGILDDKKVKEAREYVIKILENIGALVGSDGVVQSVKIAERSRSVLEIIPTAQWYVRIIDYKDAILKKGEECKWHPHYMFVRFKNWVNGLNQDWCVSRQRYFGIPFPVWYSKRPGEEGKILLPDIEQLPIDPSIDLPEGYSKEEVYWESDVMDTWATSALTPQICTFSLSSGMTFDNKEFHEKLFPFDLRTQAHEIIRTWAFSSITKSLFHENSIPWKNLMISGWCLAKDRSKMSKSKGNTVTPGNLLDTYGTDVIRYWAVSAKLGTDIVYNDAELKVGKKLVNKLWNMGKFVKQHIEDVGFNYSVLELIKRNEIFCTLDIWIISAISKGIQKITKAFKTFDYHLAMDIAQEMFWNICDNYLELVKKRAYDGDIAKQRSARLTLRYCLESVLKSFSPFMPYVTEEINFLVLGSKDSIHKRGNWFSKDDFFQDESSLQIGYNTVQILALVRKAKSERSIALNAPLQNLKIHIVDNTGIAVSDLKDAANTEKVDFVKNMTSEKICMSACKKYKVALSD